jgi:hypothetical protein
VLGRLGDRGIQSLLTASQEHEPVALIGEVAGDRAADPAAGPCDDRDVVRHSTSDACPRLAAGRG